MEQKNELSVRFMQAYEYLLKNKVVNDRKDFANRLGISSSMITEISKGRSNVGVAAIQNIVLQFDISPSWLLTGSGSMLCSDSSGTISGDISNSAVSTAGPAINTVGQHSVELQTENHHLQQRISDLERLLDEKERLISILLSKQ